MPINAMVYSGKRHVCTRIDKFQNGLARFTKLSVNSDSTGEKVRKTFKMYRGQFLAPHDMYRTVLLSKRYTQKATGAQSICLRRVQDTVRQLGLVQCLVHTKSPRLYLAILDVQIVHLKCIRRALLYLELASGQFLIQ